MISDFYNTNLSRFYPFQETSPIRLPHYAVADFGCSFFAGVTFDPLMDQVVLRYIRLVGDDFEFVFECDVPGLEDKQLIFQVSLSDGRYATLFSREQPALTSEEVTDAGTASHAVAVTEAECGNAPLWEGYLVVGDLVQLKQYLIDNCAITGMYLYDPVAAPALEPANIATLGEQQLRVVGVANKERTRSKPSTGCRDLCWPLVQSDIYVVADCLQGNIVLDDGYNLALTQSVDTNTVSLTASVGGGLGRPGEELPVVAGEEPPQGFTTLSGSLRCCEVVRSINGVGGPVFLIQEGAGVSVITQPNLNRVIIDFNFHDLAACPTLPEPEDVPCLPPSDDPCDCGPANPDDFECPPTTVDPTTTPAPTTQPPDPTSPPGTGIWAIAICNSNNVTDDMFEVRLNGNVLGLINLTVDPGSGPCKGAIYGTDIFMPATVLDNPLLVQSTDICRCNAVGVVPFDINLLVAGTNEIKMRNVINLGQNNYGRVIVFKVRLDGGVYVVERVELDVYYQGVSGEDFTANFQHSW